MKLIKMFLVLLLLLNSGCASKKREDTVIINEDGINAVRFDDKEMNWFRFGNENGPKVIILPGISFQSVMGSKEAIIDAYAPLAEEYDVYLFERIRVLPGKYSVEEMAEDTLRAIHAIGLKNINIMGVSLGGMVAMVMAMKDTENVHSVMLCSTSSRVTDTAVLEKWKQLAEERNTPALMDAFGRYVYSPSFYEQYKDLIIASGNGANERDFKNFITSVEACMEFNCYDDLNNITCPALVIGASEDLILGVQASYDIIGKLQCEGFIYEGYAHAAYDEAPDYLTHIKGFLDAVTK